MVLQHLRRRTASAVALLAVGAAGTLAAPATASAAPTAERVTSGTVSGHVADAVAARAICGNRKRAVAGYGKWATSTSECSVFGSASTPAKPATWGYKWQTAPYSNGRVCVQGLGYIWDAKKKKKTVSKWYSLGCGTGGSGKVPWRGKPYTVNGKKYYQGVAATPKVRAKVQLGFLGAAYDWWG